MTTTRTQYEWLVPIDSLGRAHAFVFDARLSACVSHERWPLGELAWVRESRLRGEPKRMRCHHCVQVLAHPDNAAMREVTHET